MEGQPGAGDRGSGAGRVSCGVGGPPARLDHIESLSLGCLRRFAPRVAALASLGPDPRIAAALADAIVDGVPGWHHEPVYDAVLEAFVLQRDPAQIARLSEVADAPRGKTIDLREYQARALAPMLDRARALEIDPDDARQWETPKAAPREEEAALLAVYADPGDDSSGSTAMRGSIPSSRRSLRR